MKRYETLEVDFYRTGTRKNPFVRCVAFNYRTRKEETIPGEHLIEAVNYLNNIGWQVVGIIPDGHNHKFVMSREITEQ